MRARRWAGIGVGLGVFLAGVLTYAGQLRPGWAPPGSDVLNYVYPYAVYLSGAWNQGRWPPLWNPDVFMGVPYLANIQAETLYPPNLLLGVAPVLPALAWLQALHVGVAGLGMYLYGLRAVRLGRAGSAVAAIIFMIGPFLTGQMAHVDLLDAVAWAPWLMLAVDRCVRRPRLWLSAVVGLLVALVLLAGHPQGAYLTLILGALAGLAGIRQRVVARRWAEAGRAVGAGFLGVLVGLGLAAAQLVPTAELLSQSIRSTGVDPSLAADSPLYLRGIVGSVLPHYSSQLTSELTGASLGAAALALATLALLTRWRSPFVWGWLILGLVCLWAATGHSGRLYDLLYQVVPGLGLFRVPARLLLFTTVALALLAGLGTRVALALARARRPVPLLAAGAVALVPCLSAAGYQLAGSPDLRWLRFLPNAPGPAAGDLALAALFVCAVPAAGLAAVMLPRMRPALGPALVLLVLADTWLATQPIYSRTPLPAAAYSPGGGARDLIAADTGSRYLSLVPTDTGLIPNQGMSSGRLSADGYDGGVLPLHRYVEFRRPLLPPGSGNRPDYILPFLTEQLYNADRLRQTGATVVIAADGSDPNGGGCGCLLPGAARDGVRAWSVPDPLGRAWLESGSGREPQRVVSDSGERVEVAVSAGQPGLLVLADSDYPGWTAQVDGRTVPIQRWQGLLRAVPVPAGEHEVVFTFAPRSVGVGYALSLLAALLTLALLLSGVISRFWRS